MLPRETSDGPQDLGGVLPFHPLQHGLIVGGIACFGAGAAAIRRHRDIVGVGLWQIGVLCGVGAIATGNVRHVVAAVRSIEVTTRRQSVLLESLVGLAQQEVQELGRLQPLEGDAPDIPA